MGMRILEFSRYFLSLCLELSGKHYAKTCSINQESTSIDPRMKLAGKDREVSHALACFKS